MREADLAREVGVPPWKLRTIRTSHAAGPAGIARAIRPSPRPTPTSRARLSDASYTLERLVLTVAALRDPR
jgi:DNA polymerase-3 subunit delta